jgi:predicted Zn-dependent protease
MIRRFQRISIALLLCGLVSFPAFSRQQTTDQQKQDSKNKPKNSDIDDIGNRNINKGSINFTSIQKEMALGRQLADEVERQVKLLNDPVIGEYVNRIGQNLVRNSDAKVPFTIKVVQDDEINAFALPGGFFYVNTGLIEAADDEAELAAVMGHEIAHVAARHATENAAKGELANIASIPLIMVGGPAGYGLQQAAGFLVPLQFLHFSRANESEADYLGLQYMYKAGYDPSAFVSMFEKLEAKETNRAGSVSKMFSTHPATADRIEATKKNIERILPDRDNYVVTTSEFDNVKARLVSLENNPPQKDNGKPTIRRSNTGTDRKGTVDKDDSKDDPKGTDESKPSDDDRPTVKRRPPQ